MQQQTLHALKQQATHEHLELAAICSLTQQQKQQNVSLNGDVVGESSISLPVMSQPEAMAYESDLVTALRGTLNCIILQLR